MIKHERKSSRALTEAAKIIANLKNMDRKPIIKH